MAFMSWLPPLYNAEHVPTTDPNTGAAWVGEVPGRSLYRATCLLGPISIQVASKIPLFLWCNCYRPGSGSYLE